MRIVTSSSQCSKGYLTIYKEECIILQKMNPYNTLTFTVVTKVRFENALKGLPRTLVFYGFDYMANDMDIERFLSQLDYVSHLLIKRYYNKKGYYQKKAIVMFTSWLTVEDIFDTEQRFTYNGSDIHYCLIDPISFRSEFSHSIRNRTDSTPEYRNSNINKKYSTSCMPNLDFTGHKDKSKTPNPLGGYYIRPYFRKASVISENSIHLTNVRFNILKAGHSSSNNNLKEITKKSSNI